MLITHIAHKHLNRAVYEKGGDGGASKAQAKAQQQAIDLQREQWNTVMNNLKPYAEVGLPALQQLQGLMTLEGQNIKHRQIRPVIRTLSQQKLPGGLAQQLPVTSYLPLRPCFITIGLVGKCKIMETC